MYSNPYFDNTFFEFFITLATRCSHALFGASLHLASDELQMLVLILISITTSFIGTFLMLRRMTMLANSLSHTILPGIVISYLLYRLFQTNAEILDFTHSIPNEFVLVAASLMMAFITTSTTHMLVETMGVKEDAATGMVFTFLFAVGVALVTFFSRNAHIGTELLMGNIDALGWSDLILQSKIFLLVAILGALFYRAFVVTTFDPVFATVFGLKPALFGYFLMGLVAVVATGAFRAVGVLQVLAFFVAQPLIARRFTHRLIPLLFISAAVGVITSIIGVALSRHLLSFYGVALSTSALIVTLLSLLYLVVLLTRRRA